MLAIITLSHDIDQVKLTPLYAIQEINQIQPKHLILSDQYPHLALETPAVFLTSPLDRQSPHATWINIANAPINKESQIDSLTGYVV